MARRILFGSYELLDRIGEGGMAEVWRARARGVAGFEKTVVIKRVLPSMMARRDFASLLVREAKIAALLNHPNVVQIFELGEEQGSYYIAMEHVHGCDLASALTAFPDPKTTEGLTLPLRIWIAAESAKALDYAHRMRADDGRPLQIVHRDVSPQNVLLGYQGQVKVADFGIALADQIGLGREEDPGVVRGKYAYMSPEQTRGEPLDRRSDVFALGVVLHEMLMGKRLFKGVDSRDTIAKVVGGPIPPIDVDALGAPPLLQEVLHHALARDREARYPTAGTMAEELSQVLVQMSAHVGPSELTETLFRIAPPDESRANKLRVDLLARADEDASVATLDTATPMVLTEPTIALPTSQKMRSEKRAVLVLMAHPDPDVEFSTLCAQHGGATLPVVDGVCEAVFGVGADPERVVGAALRAALSLRSNGYQGPAVVVHGDARVIQLPSGERAANPLPTTRERGLLVLEAEARPVVRCDPQLRAEVAWRFELKGEDEWPEVVAPRRRTDRELGALRQGPFVGRRSILHRLESAVLEAAEGRGGALLLLGSAGVGKSRLLAEVRAGLARASVGVLLAHGSETVRDVPFAALQELVGDLCGVEEDDSGETKGAKLERLRVLGWSPREVLLARQLLGLDVDVPERAGRPRAIELVVALRKAIHALADDAPLVIFLEDLHWMDDATRQVLDLLVAGLGRTRVLLLATARPGAALPYQNVERVVVPPLDPEAAARVFAHRVGARGLEEDRSRELQDLVGGNPAWITLLADALREQGRLLITDGVVHGWGASEVPLPGTMLARLAARIESLPRRARELVRTVAAFERPVDLSTVTAVESLPRDLTEPIVLRLLRAELLRPGRGGMRVPPVGRWGGDEDEPLPATLRIAGGGLVRRCIFDALPERVQRNTHARIADVLRRSGARGDDRVEALAHHALMAGDFERAPAELSQAADVALARDAPMVAAERLAAAARIGESMETQERALLAIRAAEIALDAGGTDFADAVLLEPIPVSDDANLTFRRGLAEARVHARREHWPEVVERIGALFAELEDAGDEALRGRALVVLGEALVESGKVAAAVDTLDRAVDALGSDEARVGHALCGLAVALARAGEGRRAREVGMDALVAAVRHGGLPLRWQSLAASAEVAEAAGDIEIAFGRWSDAARLARDAEMDEALARSGVRAAISALAAGHEGEASIWVETAVRAARRCDLEVVVSLGEAVRAALVLAAHPDPHFVKGMVRAIEHLESIGRLGEAAMALEMLARAHVELDDVGAAIRTLGRAGPLAAAAGRPLLEERLGEQAKRLARGEGWDGLT
ncbi:MAG: protein kinase [Myxococcota bacterium]